MKKINVTTILVLLLVAFAGYKIVKRFVMLPKLTFQSEQLTAVDSNYTTTIAALKGKVLIVSCYQTWCGDCARETQGLNELAAKINSPNFTVLYISDEPEEKVNKFRQRFPSGKILFTKFSRGWGDLGIHSFPTTFLINKKGEVIKTKLEAHDWPGEEAAIKKLLAEE